MTSFHFQNFKKCFLGKDTLPEVLLAALIIVSPTDHSHLKVGRGIWSKTGLLQFFPHLFFHVVILEQHLNTDINGLTCLENV